MRPSCLLLLAACAGVPDKTTPTDPVDSEPSDSEPADSEPSDSEPPPVEPLRWSLLGHEVSLQVDEGAELRTYTLSSTQPLRDSVPADGRRTFTEPVGAPRLRSGHPLLDALFALATTEARENSVAQITDGGFRNGQPVDCACFETGELWPYVWTRDTAYAVDLGLAAFDPSRARQSLEFKLSTWKTGGGLQIVQDTGTGGSWPVSTDRAAWAIGARRLLGWLDGAERDAFRDLALTAMANTIEADRDAVFDPHDGLYRGEQSFLDWREQSYPSWTATDPATIAGSKALSTNLTHLALLETAAQLAEEVNDPRAAGWREQADALRLALQAFWRADDGLPSTLLLSPLDPTPLPKWDHLGTSLAVLEQVFSPEQSAAAVRNYPHTEVGPPVIWPQQAQTRIYHNRALWPFVTAYGLLAAREVGNDAVFDQHLTSLIRGSALNLSNMENHEFLTQAPWVDAGAESGPVVNSRRQLWSVAGYLGAFVHGLFGVDADRDGLHLDPFVTAGLRADWLGETEQVSLLDLPYRGHLLDLHLHLPPDRPIAGVLRLDRAELDGAAIPLGPLDPTTLPARAVVDLYLSADPASVGDTARVLVDDGDHRTFWAPTEPSQLTLTAHDPGLTLSWQGSGEADVRYRVYRDGALVFGDAAGTTWTDLDVERDAASPCYAIEAYYPSSGNASHHSPPACWWGEDRVELIGPHAWYVAEGSARWSTDHGRPHYGDWGQPDDTLAVWALRPRWTGPHLLQLVYGNGLNGFTTGITGGAKRLTVREAASGLLIASGVIALPQRGDWGSWADSTTLRAELRNDRSYRLELSDVANMSYLEHFRDYTGGAGGGPTPSHAVNVHALKLLPLSGAPAAALTPAVTFDGTDDLLDHDPTQRWTADELGDPSQPWSAFALSWDAEHLYFTLVSERFEEDDAPWMIYLEASDGPPGDPSPSEGSPYQRGLVQAPAALPFTPTHQVTARPLDAYGPQDGPWNGLWSGPTQVRRLAPDLWLAGDRHTLSVRLRRADLGDPTHLRVVAHVLVGAAGAAFVERVPAGHAPEGDGGEWVEVAL